VTKKEVEGGGGPENIVGRDDGLKGKTPKNGGLKTNWQREETKGSASEQNTRTKKEWNRTTEGYSGGSAKNIQRDLGGEKRKGKTL